MKIFKTNENGFSLVELAIAAGLAVALAATAVTVLSGTTANLSSKALASKTTLDCYNNEVVSNADNLSCESSNSSSQNHSSSFESTWDGVNLSYTIGTSCNLTSPDISFYYVNSGGGETRITTVNYAAIQPASLGVPLGAPLGYGVTVTGYYVMLNCDGVLTRSSNTVS